MASFEARQQSLEKVRGLLDEISKIDPKTLSRVDELSRSINFSEAVPYFQEMIDIVRQLADRDIKRLTSNQLNQIHSGCTNIQTLVSKVMNFDINQNTPGDVCNAIVLEIKNAYDTIMEPLILPLAFTAVQATDYAKIEREAKGYFSTMKEERDKLISFLAKAQEEGGKALAAVQEQAAQAGVSTNAHIFQSDVQNHTRKAKQWFFATIITSAITLISAIAFLIVGHYYQPATSAAAVQYLVSKILILSTLSFGIFWSARNYKAEKHNETLNQHRANALMTFKAFYEGSDDPQIKAAILLHAAQAAFNARPTGYDGQDKEVPTTNPIVEVIGKSIRPSS